MEKIMFFNKKKKKEELEKAYSRGYNTGYNQFFIINKNPYSFDSEEYQTWQRGFLDGGNSKDIEQNKHFFNYNPPKCSG